VALKKEFANLSFGIHPRAHARGPLPILIDISHRGIGWMN